MSTSWSRQIGSFVGGTLAGPAGAIIGGIATSILGQAVEIDDPIRDAIGGVIGDEAGGLLGHLNPVDAQQINHDLQTAFRDAFCEAVYDIGGESCFAEVWKKAPRNVPLEVVYPKSGAPHLWAALNPLAAQLCECLHQMEQAVDELLPLEPPADHLAANVERYLSTDTPQALADEFFTQILAPYLTQFRVLFLEVNNFEPHLRRHLFNRLLIHLGEHLKQRPEAWRAFNRLVLEEIRLRVRALGSGQTHITKQLEQIIAQLSHPHDDGDADRALSSLTDHLADLMTATGQVERELNEGFDGLLTRVNEVMTSLAQLIRISESGNKRLIRVAGDVTKSAVIIGDHNTIIQKFTEGLSRLPTNYATRIQNFMHEYLGTSTRQVPFGGRETELAALDAWLDDPNAPPYALLAAEAGRGKSALLVQWVQSLVARDKATVVFVPVSIRFDTNRATVAFTALAARLGEVYGEPIEWKNLSAREWQGVCETYLRRSPPDGKPLVVILDGLDEAADFSIGASFFPSSRFNLEAAATGGRAMRAVVSARYLAGDVDESGWRRRLGWEREALAVNLPLPPLTPDGLRDVLHQMGNPLDQLATNVDVVGQLYRLSEGDPLLVRLYVEALLPYGERAAIMTPEQLEAIQPGLSGYFERWWEEQEAQWEAQERNPLGEKEEVLTFFNLCAAALGPLTRNEIAEIAGRPLSSGLRLKRIANELERFIIGDGKTQGYTFSHPRLSYYFWEEMTQREQGEWEERFLNFGHHTLEALNDGTLHPHKAPSYAIQYYGAHLERADASPEAFYALVSEGWMRAWEALEGTYAGFLNDVERAWQWAEGERDIAMQIKCALCQASVATLSGNISSELLAQAVRHNLLTPIQALVIAQQKPSEKQYALALSELAPYLPPKLLRKALQETREIYDEQSRAKVIKGLVAYLPDDCIAEALNTAWAINDPRSRFDALKGLVAHLSDEDFSEVLDTIQAIDDEESRTKALSELVTDLPTKWLKKACQVAQEIKDLQWRGNAISIVMTYWPKENLQSLIRSAQEIQNEWLPKEFLSFLAPHLPQELLNEVFYATLEINDENLRANQLLRLVPYLPQELLNEAFCAAQKIQDESWRTEIFSRLTPCLPKECSQEALRIIQEITSYRFKNSPFLSRVVAKLPKEYKKELLHAALKIKNESWLLKVLASLAPHLPKECLPKLLTIVNEIKNKNLQRKVLFAIGPSSWPKEHLEKMLSDVQKIKDESWQAKTLLQLASYLPQERLQEALCIAEKIKDQRLRINTLLDVAAHLPKESKKELLGTTRKIQDDSRPHNMLLRLAPHLPKESKKELLPAALEIQDELLRTWALSAVVPHLPKESLNEAFRAVLKIQDETSQVGVLSKLVSHPHLPKELLNKVLRITEKTENKSLRHYMRLMIVAHLPKELLNDPLKFASVIQDHLLLRIQALTQLAAHLPKVRPQVLHAVLAINQDQARAKALSDIAPYLPQELLDEAFYAAQEIKDDFSRTKALSVIALYLSEPNKSLAIHKALKNVPMHPIEELEVNMWNRLARLLESWVQTQPTKTYAVWQQMLRNHSEKPRPTFLKYLHILTPLTLALQSEKKEEVAEGIFRAIQEVCAWWP